MQCDAMHAVAHLRGRVGNVLRVQTLIDRFPVRAAVITAKRTRRGDRYKDPLTILRVQKNRVQAHAARAGLPLRTGAVTTETGQFMPSLAAVLRAEQRGIFDARVDRVRIVERWLEVPD